MPDKLIYLATPYSSKFKTKKARLRQQAARFTEAMRITSGLMKNGCHIYSPIVHCHPMAVVYGLPTDWQYWQTYLKVMLPKCDELWVAMMLGWNESTGVDGEMKLAKELDKPIKYVNPTNLYVLWNTSS